MEKRAINQNPTSKFLVQVEEQATEKLNPLLKVVGALIPEATI